MTPLKRISHNLERELKSMSPRYMPPALSFHSWSSLHLRGEEHAPADWSWLSPTVLPEIGSLPTANRGSHHGNLEAIRDWGRGTGNVAWGAWGRVCPMLDVELGRKGKGERETGNGKKNGWSVLCDWDRFTARGSLLFLFLYFHQFVLFIYFLNFF